MHPLLGGRKEITMKTEINGIIIKGKVFEITERGCFHCVFGHDLLKEDSGSCPVKEICEIFPYPNEEKDNCFRFSQELTDKINEK